MRPEYKRCLRISAALYAEVIDLWRLTGRHTREHIREEGSTFNNVFTWRLLLTSGRCAIYMGVRSARLAIIIRKYCRPYLTCTSNCLMAAPLRISHTCPRASLSSLDNIIALDCVT